MKIDKKATGFLAVLIAWSIIFNGCGILPKEEQVLAPPLVKPKKQEYVVYEVKKKDITRQIKGNGMLISTYENNIFTRENGKRVKNIKVQFGQNVKKGDVLVELDSNNLESDIKLQQLNLEKAQINFDRAEQGTDEYSKKLANIDVQMEKTKLENLQKQLTLSRIVANADGKVVFLESIKEGDLVEAYQPLVTIADPTNLQVVYQGGDSSKVQPGMKVEISLNGKKCEGVVAQLTTSGKYKDSIIINFNEAFKEGKLGDGIEINITLETKKDTIVVPKAAVKSFMGSNTVEVLDGEKKISVNIEKGIENSTEIEILSGLKEGQMVILN
jgi:RND family efflux transporter MFP subunit